MVALSAWFITASRERLSYLHPIFFSYVSILCSTILVNKRSSFMPFIPSIFQHQLCTYYLGQSQLCTGSLNKRVISLYHRVNCKQCWFWCHRCILGNTPPHFPLKMICAEDVHHNKVLYYCCCCYFQIQVNKMKGHEAYKDGCCLSCTSRKPVQLHTSFLDQWRTSILTHKHS